MNFLSKFFMKVHANSGQSFAVTGRTDPYKAFNFRVTITGKKNFAKFGFTRVTGLKATTDVVEYRDGNDLSITPRKSAGLVKYDPVTLERGMSEDTDMMDWLQLNARTNGSGASNDSQMLCTVKIELLDRDRAVVKTWELLDAWIADYEIGELDASSSAVLIERMVINYNGMSFINGRANS